MLTLNECVVFMYQWRDELLHGVHSISKASPDTENSLITLKWMTLVVVSVGFQQLYSSFKKLMKSSISADLVCDSTWHRAGSLHGETLTSQMIQFV